MLLLVDKPKGISSFGVVAKLRKITGQKRIGHAGTLDPNATGLLIVGIGRESTRKLGDLAKGTRKTYIADIFLGEERDTDDSEGKITNVWEGITNLTNSDVGAPSLQKVIHTIEAFEGKQEQIPPIFSAIKKNGKKAYEVARKGHTIEMEPRSIEIFSIQLIAYNFPLLIIEVECSSGTYIRALARDIGKKLGTFGYLKDLRRTKIGEYRVEKAGELDELTKDMIEKYKIE